MSEVWLTPPAIIEALGGAEGFDLDPCSLHPRPWPTALHHFTEYDNGLLRGWWGRVWLNPPYSSDLVTRFLGRMAEHDCGVALTFARTETDAFHRFVWDRASGLLFLRGRLNFHRADGTRAPAGAMVEVQCDDREFRHKFRAIMCVDSPQWQQHVATRTIVRWRPASPNARVGVISGNVLGQVQAS